MLIPKKYSIGISISLIVIAVLCMLLYNIRNPQPGLLRKMSMEVASFTEKGVSLPFKGLASIWNRYIYLVGLEASNRVLRSQNSHLTEELIRYREGYQEGIRLQKLMKLRESLPYSTIAARVLGRNPSSIFRMIIINLGENDGLHAGMPVMAASGVVGRILETSWNVSRVLLMVDENSNIDALIQDSRARGILQGASSTGCNLKYVSKTLSIKVGDVVISSGVGGIFPKGLPLGVVRSVNKKEADMFQKINVAPFVDSSAIEEVLVLKTERNDRK